MKNTYEVKGPVTVIHIFRKGQMYECLISTPKLSKAELFEGNWIAHYNAYTGKTYAVGCVPNSKVIIKMHRYLIDAPKGVLVDHRNHNTLDNTDENLSLVDKVQNAQNRKGLDANNTSGVRGVCWNKQSKTWRARIKLDGKHLEVGSFKDINEAAKAVHEARMLHYPYLRSVIEGGNCHN